MAPPPPRPWTLDGCRGQVSSVCAVGEIEIRPARAAGGPRTSRTGTRRHHKPIRAARSGSAGTVCPRQDEGRPPRRSLRIRSRSVSGGPGGPGAHPFLPQFDVRHVQAEVAAPGNGGSSFSSFPIPSNVPRPPGRSSPEVSAGVRQCFCCKPTHVGAQQGTGF
ncbi:hypothetical protein NDU88_004740 [Pleurodeles waltl]|uniref:Uncharacterized protein n=1 Tax=Pleurodeles waltl TaxID=8319 RepID=A0AAV7W634_PLEWA|nr:hypothetical protein NDU88_004740 [Pleurodeles waltl]